MVARASFTPDVDIVTLIEAGLPALGHAGFNVAASNLVAGDRAAYDVSGGIKHACIFVNASGGSPSRPIKDGVTDERRIRIDIQIRGNKGTTANAFREALRLARDVSFLVDANPPAGWCELRVINSQPSFIERDDDGHPWFMVPCEGVVDVTPT